MTKYIYLDGTIKWAGGLNKIDEKYNTYNAQFYPTPEALAEFKAIGSSVKIKEDEDGPNFKIKREVDRVFRNQDTGENELRQMGAPRVFKQVETQDGDFDIDLDPATVGNGSGVTVKLAYFESPKYKTVGCRLEAVRVNEHIVYIPQTEDTLPF